MYSGTTLNRGSGRIVGVHQKIDRIARRKLDKCISDSVSFPGIKDILHFEGKNGPDGIKLKSPTQDELDHSIDPNNPSDKALLNIINDHIANLSKSLTDGNKVRAAFEAAWLAHAVVDGLTPAHHYPLGDEIKKTLTESDYQDFNLSYGDAKTEYSRKVGLKKKWETWGPSGIVTHVMFELGVASVITTDGYKKININHDQLDDLKINGYDKVFLNSVREVYDLGMYDEFCKKGWTTNLAQQTKKILIPIIIKSVVLAWYQAIILSEKYQK